MKFFRIVFLYCFYLFLSVLAATAIPNSFPVGAQMLFVFVVPALILWWHERDRTTEAAQTTHEPARNTIATQQAQAKPIKRSVTRRSGWIAKGETLTISGRDIGGMVYVGTPSSVDAHRYGLKCGAYINPSLSVASSRRDKEGHELPYYPRYSDIPSVCRAAYLDWLASGRSDPSYNPGYLFLYFYGLERRFLIDGTSDNERREVLEEVRRLKNIYPESRSVKRYLEEFIQVAQIFLNDAASQEPIFDNRGDQL